MPLDEKPSKSKIKPKKYKGEVSDEDGIPYNYIIIIDAGSKGTRAYIYSWKSVEYLLANSHRSRRSGDADERLIIDDSDILANLDLKLLKRIDHKREHEEEEDQQQQEQEQQEDQQEPDIKIDEELLRINEPNIITNKKWHKKIKPGIETFVDDPQSIGPKYLSHLLKKCYDSIPIEQHYRTPLFLHSTAGMRLLPPNEQDLITSEICEYFQKNSNFFVPDCSSHVNIIDGNLEGLYGWLSLNYLTGSLHEKFIGGNKLDSSFGLLEMGGASTQIAFEPKSIENIQNSNALFGLTLLNDKNFKFNVFATSFLGYGINQSHKNYLKNLSSNDNLKDNKIFDPCLPKDLNSIVKFPNPDYNITDTEKDNTNDESIYRKVIGLGDFDKCMESIYPILIESSESCSADKSPQEVSKCLLSDSIPEFEYKLNKFYGVSGYWDAMSDILNLNDKKNQGAVYSYESFSKETARICNMKWTDLNKFNDKLKVTPRDDDDDNDDDVTPFSDLSDNELTELCFKSSWVLNVLHRGLGFPKLKENESLNDSKEKSSIQISDKINGYEFTWTLGRALLYAFDENSIDYYHYVNNNQLSVKNYPNIGYFQYSSPGIFTRGSEQDGIERRPIFQIFDSYKEPNFLSDEIKYHDEYKNWKKNKDKFKNTGNIDNDYTYIYNGDAIGDEKFNELVSESNKSNLFPSSSSSSSSSISTFFISILVILVILLLILFKYRGVFNEVILFFNSIKQKFIINGGNKGTKIHWPLVTKKRYKRIKSLEIPNRSDNFEIDDNDDTVYNNNNTSFNDLHAANNHNKLDEFGSGDSYNRNVYELDNFDRAGNAELGNGYYSNEYEDVERNHIGDDNDAEDDREEEEDEEDEMGYESDDIENFTNFSNDLRNEIIEEEEEEE
ncbi:hypothetical protein B5S30_g189 [[Candida] boidinii]|nr:hypothetical protein B5S30_g189 [[Candida] boidinii]